VPSTGRLRGHKVLYSELEVIPEAKNHSAAVLYQPDTHTHTHTNQSATPCTCAGTRTFADMI